MISGRVLYVDGQEIWRAVARKLLRSNDGGRSWTLRAVLPTNCLSSCLVFSRLGRRLGRAGYHHLVKTGIDSGYIIAHQHVFQLKPGDRKLHRVMRLKGSRPLSLCVAQGRVYYGEYRGNPERTPIHIWANSPDEIDWIPVWHFEGIRHVHGVFFDPYTPAIWVTTGDYDNESAIWMTRDQFQTLDFVIGGSQQYRAVQLLFTEGQVYFGSDTPNEINHIYRLERSTGRVEHLTAVANSVFYGCKVGASLFFSTAVEPSEVNQSSYTEIWGSATGDDWRLLNRFCKDRWSMKYFQYGQVFFPAGPGDGVNLWFTPMATSVDQDTLKIKVDSLFGHEE